MVFLLLIRARWGLSLTFVRPFMHSRVRIPKATHRTISFWLQTSSWTRSETSCWKRDCVVSSHVKSRSSILPVTSAKLLSGIAMMIGVMFTRVQTWAGRGSKSSVVDGTTKKYHDKKASRSHTVPCARAPKEITINKEQGRAKRVPTVLIYVSINKPN